MRKLTFLFACICMTGLLNAQVVNVKKILNTPQTYGIKKSVVYENSQKDINAALNETFETTTFPPTGWSKIGTALHSSTETGNWAAVESNYATGHSGHFVIFDSYFTTLGTTSSLISPKLQPVAGSNTLSYKVQVIKVGAAGENGSGVELYLEYSINSGTTWTTSTTNVLTPVASYNTATTAWTTLTADMSAYNGQQVMVRFRCVSDYGWMVLGIDDVTGPSIASSTNDIAAGKTWADFDGSGYYSIIPNTQLGQVAFNSYVDNAGTAAQTNVTLHVDMNNGSFSGATGTNNPIASLASLAHDSLAVTLSPTSTTTTQFGAKLWLSQDQTDEIAANNIGDSVYFVANPKQYWRTLNADMYATPYSFGAQVAASTNTVFGSTYLFLNNSNVDSIYAYTYKIKAASGNTSIKAVLYNIDLTTQAVTQVDSSASLAVTTVATSNGDLRKFKLLSPYQVTGPAFLLAGIKMTFGVGDTISILGSSASAFPGNTGLASDCHLNTTANGWVWTPVTFAPMIGLNINPSTQVESVNANSSVSVYPNPTTGKLNIVNAKNSIVTVFNMLGQEVVKMNSTSATSTIDISNMAEGTYFVKIQSEGNVTTKKINLVK